MMLRLIEAGFRRSQCGRWWENADGVRLWDGWVCRHEKIFLTCSLSHTV
jgi:hypothetical protein